MLPLLAAAWDAGITPVVSLGNTPLWTLGDTSPQRYGRSDNALIMVASVDSNGERSVSNPSQASARDGADGFLTGSITIHAQGNLVKIAKPQNPSRLFDYDSGSSFAAPQVAGLAAYFQGFPVLGHIVRWI